MSTMKTLSARSSPWATPVAWAAASPEAKPRKIGSISNSGIGVPPVRSSSVAPERRSITKTPRIDDLDDVRVAQLRHSQRLTCEILDHRGPKPRTPSVELDHQRPQPRHAVRLEELARSPHPSPELARPPCGQGFVPGAAEPHHRLRRAPVPIRIVLRHAAALDEVWSWPLQEPDLEGVAAITSLTSANSRSRGEALRLTVWRRCLPR